VRRGGLHPGVPEERVGAGHPGPGSAHRTRTSASTTTGSPWPAWGSACGGGAGGRLLPDPTGTLLSSGGIRTRCRL
jgi:hypothetical protein